MLYKEQDLEKFEKKIVYACHYLTDSKQGISRFGFTPYYDLGEGFCNEKQLKEENERSIWSCKYQSDILENDRQRLICMRDLYAYAKENAYPIFLKFDEDYFFFNEFTFTKPDKEEIFYKLIEHEKELGELMEKHKKEQFLGEYRPLKKVRVYK